jgi:hypothetical protein
MLKKETHKQLLKMEKIPPPLASKKKEREKAKTVGYFLSQEEA